MTDIDKRIDEINHKIRDAYYAKQITAVATDIINELGAISKELQAQVVERDRVLEIVKQIIRYYNNGYIDILDTKITELEEAINKAGE